MGEIEGEGAAQGSIGEDAHVLAHVTHSPQFSGTPWNSKLSFISSSQLSTSAPQPHNGQMASNSQMCKTRDLREEGSFSLFLAVFLFYPHFQSFFLPSTSFSASSLFTIIPPNSHIYGPLNKISSTHHSYLFCFMCVSDLSACISIYHMEAWHLW